MWLQKYVALAPVTAMQVGSFSLWAIHRWISFVSYTVTNAYH
jgi:hypothetical protein